MEQEDHARPERPARPHDLSVAEEKLLLAAWDRRRRAPRVATAETLQASVDEGVEGDKIALGPAFPSLAARGWLVADGDRWTLSPSGVPEAQRLMRAAMCEGFGKGLVRCAQSPTYVEYCRRVYGTDGFRFNMVDTPQLEKLLDVMALSPGQRFVDLGCAVGALTEWIAVRTGAHGTGIDFAAPAIDFALQATTGASDRLAFAVGDLNAISLPQRSFDVAVAIDTLYFVDDVEQVVGDILALLRPGGRFAAFYSVTRQDDEPLSALAADQTLLARALCGHGVEFCLADFTDNSHALWSRAQEAAEALEGAWKAEGNEEIWQSRSSEAAKVLSTYAEGRARRYLYWASCPSAKDA